MLFRSGELVIFNDEVCGSDENQFELIGVIHQCATHNFEGFRMFYQPIADTKTGKIRGMEALLRWELEPYGMVSPRCVHGMAGTGPLYF